MTSRRLIVLCAEAPFPPHHGGRVDVSSRLIGLRRLGWELLVMYWCASPEDHVATVDALDRLGIERFRVFRQRRLRDLLQFRYPSRSLSFALPAAVHDEALAIARRFEPNALLHEGWETYLPAAALANALGIPRYYRSQNVEHLYWKGQLRLAPWRKKLPFLLAVPRLYAVESAARKTATLVLDISPEDNAWWTSRTGEVNSVVLLPTWAESPPPRVKSPSFDLLYGGNLYAPNSVDGLRWFADSVLPVIRQRISRPLRIALVGSRPSPEVRAICSDIGAECVADVPDLREFYTNARVLLNPVRHSSGVNMKMFGMLAAEVPIVSTSAGARGLPLELRDRIDVADDAATFASAVVAGLGAPHPEMTPSNLELIEALCGVTRLGQIFDE